MPTKHKLAGALAALSLLSPSLALAALPARQNLPEARTENPAPNFCTNLPAFTAQINDRQTKAGAALDQRQTQRQTQLQERQNTRNQQLSQLRTDGDAERQAIYQQLTEKAQTEEQKTAVTKFQNTIQAALAARRSAVDAALQAYWQGMDGDMASRQKAVADAKQNFNAAVQSALAAAKSQCESGTVPLTARQNFNNALKAAKTKYAADLKAVDKVGQQVRARVQTRNEAVKKAMGDFRQIAEQARTELKAAFGN